MVPQTDIIFNLGHWFALFSTESATMDSHYIMYIFCHFITMKLHVFGNHHLPGFFVTYRTTLIYRSWNCILSQGQVCFHDTVCDFSVQVCCVKDVIKLVYASFFPLLEDFLRSLSVDSVWAFCRKCEKIQKQLYSDWPS